MPTDTSAPRHYAGARIHLAAGQARLLSSAGVPPGMVAGRFSVLSPGTERRHLEGPGQKAGYMTLGRKNEAEGWMLAPVPHGAAFDPACEGAVTAPPGTSVKVGALARFQQMACLGLERLPGSTDLAGAVVVGSGPVALGCALELRRRGATGVRVVTGRRHAPIGDVPGVRCMAEIGAASARLVIDATGSSSERAAAMVARGGVLGLLGTPEDSAALSALAVHRGGWTVVGMHELAAVTPGSYQDAYTTVAAWLSEQLGPQLTASWCRMVPGSLAPQVFGLLGTPGRPAEPVIIFEWTS